MYVVGLSFYYYFSVTSSNLRQTPTTRDLQPKLSDILKRPL